MNCCLYLSFAFEFELLISSLWPCPLLDYFTWVAYFLWTLVIYCLSRCSCCWSESTQWFSVACIGMLWCLHQWWTWSSFPQPRCWTQPTKRQNYFDAVQHMPIGMCNASLLMRYIMIQSRKTMLHMAYRQYYYYFLLQHFRENTKIGLSWILLIPVATTLTDPLILASVFVTKLDLTQPTRSGKFRLSPT